jgi:hypothetical protein
MQRMKAAYEAYKNNDAQEEVDAVAEQKSAGATRASKRSRKQ